ncbi:hypothetical protein MA16_Dca008209 [Dendrobium catenatum]|uniref:Uncharacterized protein n=1 Tax=Dendrobium catenatum TaxID=906689 RepID=A0A2I0X6I9_9ASPA|nr:hypothetical protein MA16_Dca008209 [Dendrobium catenatum]
MMDCWAPPKLNRRKPVPLNRRKLVPLYKRTLILPHRWTPVPPHRRKPVKQTPYHITYIIDEIPSTTLKKMCTKHHS